MYAQNGVLAHITGTWRVTNYGQDCTCAAVWLFVNTACGLYANELMYAQNGVLAHITGTWRVTNYGQDCTCAAVWLFVNTACGLYANELMKDRIFELRRKIWRHRWSSLCSYTHNLSSCEIKAWKISGLNGIQAHDCATGALPVPSTKLLRQLRAGHIVSS